MHSPGEPLGVFRICVDWARVPFIPVLLGKPQRNERRAVGNSFLKHRFCTYQAVQVQPACLCCSTQWSFIDPIVYKMWFYPEDLVMHRTDKKTVTLVNEEQLKNEIFNHGREDLRVS